MNSEVYEFMTMNSYYEFMISDIEFMIMNSYTS